MAGRLNPILIIVHVFTPIGLADSRWLLRTHAGNECGIVGRPIRPLRDCTEWRLAESPKWNAECGVRNAESNAQGAPACGLVYSLCAWVLLCRMSPLARFRTKGIAGEEAAKHVSASCPNPPARCRRSQENGLSVRQRLSRAAQGFSTGVGRAAGDRPVVRFLALG